MQVRPVHVLARYVSATVSEDLLRAQSCWGHLDKESQGYTSPGSYEQAVLDAIDALKESFQSRNWPVATAARRVRWAASSRA